MSPRKPVFRTVRSTTLVVEDSLPHLYTGLEAKPFFCKETLLKFLISCPFMERERQKVHEGGEKEVCAKCIERA